MITIHDGLLWFLLGFMALCVAWASLMAFIAQHENEDSPDARS